MIKESTKEFSSKQENKLAYELEWDVVTGSGSRPTVPGDIIGPDWLGECKTHTTAGQSISFVKDVWIKICDEAMMKHRNPVLFVDDGSQNVAKTWAMCYVNSINTSNCLMIDINQFKKMRTNITFKHEALAKYLDKFRKSLPEDVADTYEYVLITAQWAGTNVAVMPFTAFKEIISK